jgi:Transglycosylase SLT domain
MYRSLLCALAATAICTGAAAQTAPHPHPELDEMIARHARMHGIPEHLVHRVVIRESRYNPGVIHRRYYGLMQITYETAKNMGYKGEPRGLLDPDVNLTYAVPYLANAYRAADGDENRAVALYAGGYYFVAKRKKMLDQLRTAGSTPLVEAPPAPPPMVEDPGNPVLQWIQFVAGPAQAASVQANQVQANQVQPSPVSASQVQSSSAQESQVQENQVQANASGAEPVQTDPAQANSAPPNADQANAPQSDGAPKSAATQSSVAPTAASAHAAATAPKKNVASAKPTPAAKEQIAAKAKDGASTQATPTKPVATKLAAATSKQTAIKSKQAAATTQIAAVSKQTAIKPKQPAAAPKQAAAVPQAAASAEPASR